MKLAPLTLLATTLLATTATAQEDNLVETFVATLTGSSTDDARELLNTLQECGTADNGLFQDVLRTSLNATRTCSSTEELTRHHARKCIDRAATTLRLTTSPYDAFSVQRLSNADISLLAHCADNLETDDDIVDSFLLITKRFLQCDVQSLTPSQRDAILDVFQGDDQTNEINRAALSNVCSSLHFGGELHKDIVDFVTSTFKSATVLIPSRR